MGILGSAGMEGASGLEGHIGIAGGNAVCDAFKCVP